MVWLAYHVAQTGSYDCKLVEVETQLVVQASSTILKLSNSNNHFVYKLECVMNYRWHECRQSPAAWRSGGCSCWPYGRPFCLIEHDFRIRLRVRNDCILDVVEMPAAISLLDKI